MCPACLLHLAGCTLEGAESASEETERDANRAATYVGPYRLVEIIGEGGFGTVWLAEQQAPIRRRVALKVIKLGMDTRQVVARFEAERQALALMDHPNIARVLDAGATEAGRPFFVMELVEGAPITEFCDTRRLNTRERINLFIQVCQAVQHAHQKGIIHRDLKPSNLLVTEQDGRAVPKVIDFGVAKAIEEPLTDRTLFTRFHQFLGTPAYMSPEQAGWGGLDVDTRSDIYSLGVLLYELLTGVPPLEPKTLRDPNQETILQTIREVEPPKPSTRLGSLDPQKLLYTAERRREDPQKLRRLIQGDLDWIVLKAIEKDRTRRYESANGLAADLKRYLDHDPVVARPPSQLYRVRKLARRHRLLFAAVGAIAGALLIGLITTSWQMVLARQHLRYSRLNAYVMEMKAAQEAIRENNLERALELLERQQPKRGEEDLRGFEWRYLWQLCQSDTDDIYPDESAVTADFSPDGRLLAYGGWKRVIIRDAATQQVLTNLPTPAESLSFSADSQLLATAVGAKVSVWDARSWRETHCLPGAGSPTLFSPNGKWLITGDTNCAHLILWECSTWRRLADCPVTPDVRNHLYNGITFSPDGRRLVTMWVSFAEDQAGLRFWKLPNLEPCGGLFPPGIPIACAAFAEGGAHLLTGAWDGRLHVWDITGAEPELIRAAREHSSHLARIGASRNGLVLATAGEDQTVNLWEPGTYRHLTRLRGHTNQVNAMAISVDGRTLVTGNGNDGSTRVWRADRTNSTDLLNVGSLIAGFGADGRSLILGPRQRDSRWRVAGPEPYSVPLTTNAHFPQDLRCKPFDVAKDGALAVLAHSAGWVELWDLHARRPTAAWRAETNDIHQAIFSPDASQFATGSADGRIRLWSTDARNIATFHPGSQGVTALVFAPDGGVLAAGYEYSRVLLWNLADGQELAPLGALEAISGLGFSPDGRLLAVANLEGGVKLFELPLGTLVAELKGHVMGVLHAEFLPDGKTLVTGSLDGKIKLWNLATRQEIFTLSVPEGGMFHSLAVAPRGRLLAVGYLASPGHHIQLFHAPTFEEIAASEADPPRALLR
jgi:WD40 repeat protein/serine/threonine protein kinase